MFDQSFNAEIVSCELDAVFFRRGCFFQTKERKSSPYEVSTRWEGDGSIAVSSRGFYKKIRARDSLLDTLRGISWEEKVRDAQQEAFESAYVAVRDEEARSYQISKFK